jgi:hypothetical protein
MRTSEARGQARHPSLRRCARCDRLILRGATTRARLCRACARDMAAVISAAESEERIRHDLYGRADGSRTQDT